MLVARLHSGVVPAGAYSFVHEGNKQQAKLFILNFLAFSPYESPSFYAASSAKNAGSNQGGGPGSTGRGALLFRFRHSQISEKFPSREAAGVGPESAACKVSPVPEIGGKQNAIHQIGQLRINGIPYLYGMHGLWRRAERTTQLDAG